MGIDESASDRASAARGGTMEPANRATVAKERFQTPYDVPAERYELRDPFVDVTYSSNTFAAMVVKADQLGSSRFVALEADGKRTTVQKVDGEWKRGPERPGAGERLLDPTSERVDAPKTSHVDPTAGRSVQINAPDARGIAGIDAAAERAALVARLEAALSDRYVIKRAPIAMGDLTVGRTEYRFRGDTSRVAFTESTFRLATDTNSPSVARSMVDVAEARNWQGLRVSGNDDFKRMVWLEASVRGVRALGYQPNPADLELLKKEREARLVNRIEPDRNAGGDRTGSATVSSEKASARSGGGRKAVLAAIEAVLVAKRVPEKQREAILAAATEKLAERTRDGRSMKVKVHDKAAPSQRPAVTPAPDVQRSRERAAPTR